MAPAEEHVGDLLRFVRAWDRARAAGGALLCGHQPLDRGRVRHRLRAQSAARRGEIARALRDASPTATPNIRIVTLADRMLGRDGRMVAAIQAIGPGVAAYASEPFRLDLE